ncbi:MAG: MlaE family ABC transporter permease [Alphaproteobacteria bacterium]
MDSAGPPTVHSPGRLHPAGEGVVKALGDWTTATLGEIEKPVLQSARGAAGARSLDVSELGPLDTNGALLLRQVASVLGNGQPLAFVGLRPDQERLFAVIETAIEGHVEPLPEGNPISRVLERVGRTAVEQGKEGIELLSFIGAVTLTILGLIVRPWRIRWKALVTQLEATGLNALPIVGLLNFLIGVVIAYQAANQLSKFGAELLTVDSVGVGVLRELGVLITAIIVAGRSGSAFTAQIGSMRVNQEVDAMQALGLDPLQVLCAPRIIALVIALPLLVFFADVMGVLGGAVAAMFALDITMTQFAKQLQVAVSVDHFWVGMVKAPVMAAVIAAIGCFQGLKVSSNAESVGRRTTQAVVQSVFFVITIDAVFSVFFLIIGV